VYAVSGAGLLTLQSCGLGSPPIKATLEAGCFERALVNWTTGGHLLGNASFHPLEVLQDWQLRQRNLTGNYQGYNHTVTPDAATRV
jgi:hypothetical protein